MRSALSALAGAPFMKMHGAGNDFVMLDRRGAAVFAIDAAAARALADRATGVGCDQIVLIDDAADADARMTILNADGSEAEACGNASRCVARILLDGGGATATIIAGDRRLPLWRAGEDAWGVDMGPPTFDWAAIPLAAPYAGDRMAFARGPFADPTPVGMGNPHAVFFVDALDDAAIRAHGPRIENDPAFPARINVGFAQIRGADDIRLRVWERGARLTRACGSGACAALVAAARRGLTGRAADVEMDGGTLRIEWRSDDHVLMTGPAELSFTGRIAEAAA